MFVGAFAKLWKATINVVMSVRPSIHPSVRMEQLRSHWMDFQEGLRIFRKKKKCRENSSLIKIRQEKQQVLYMKTDAYFCSYLHQLFLEWETFQMKVVEKIKQYTFCSITFFFRKLCHWWDNVQTYCGAGQAKNDNMVYVGYLRLQIQTLTTRYIHCFSTTTMGAQTHLNL